MYHYRHLSKGTHLETLKAHSCRCEVAESWTISLSMVDLQKYLTVLRVAVICTSSEPEYNLHYSVSGTLLSCSGTTEFIPTT